MALLAPSKNAFTRRCDYAAQSLLHLVQSADHQVLTQAHVDVVVHQLHLSAQLTGGST